MKSVLHKILCNCKIKVNERLILPQHPVFVLGSARGLRPHHMQCCPFLGNGERTLSCAGSSLDNTPHLCHHRPIPLPVKDLLLYMGYGHRPSIATQRKTLLLGWGKGCMVEGKHSRIAGWCWTTHVFGHYGKSWHCPKPQHRQDALPDDDPAAHVQTKHPEDHPEM